MVKKGTSNRQQLSNGVLLHKKKTEKKLAKKLQNQLEQFSFVCNLNVIF